MKLTRVLVLGNDPQINRIEFDRLAKDVITVGVNRIWLKHVPNYFFFNDLEILDELDRNPVACAKLIQKAKVYSSDWLSTALKKKKRSIPSWITVHTRKNPVFPDSVSTAIDLFNQHYKSGAKCVYYIAGVSLIWQNPSHFWKEFEYDALNKNDHVWYTPRFNLIYKNFNRLKNINIPMVSVNPKSTLNKLMRYEHIENLYQKRL